MGPGATEVQPAATGVPALSIPDVVRTHGMINAVGFVGAGLLAGHVQERRGAGSWS